MFDSIKSNHRWIKFFLKNVDKGRTIFLIIYRQFSSFDSNIMTFYTREPRKSTDVTVLVGKEPLSFKGAL